ncbi:phosphorylase superfamily protein [Diplodia corticola]|uniref:Phosphorylase superfamily protein n=1 Tax=Diplodia corticola TaxID=236234 RepID=A0A1J9S3D5_9PEZI|nr:phosphorylase superfamily protein [Diplodia corticola]OJD34141.1 phosphorylase superfamily protein [Diplodia corticola]
MSTINLQGIPSEEDFKRIMHTLNEHFPVFEFGIAPQSAGRLGATVTFRQWKSDQKSIGKVERVIQAYRDVRVSSDFRGLTVLYAPQTPVVDIVAVHGLGGHAAETWIYRSSSKPVFWLRDLLPQYMATARIMTFGYNSNIVSRSTASIKTVATQLLNQVSAERQDSQRPLLFIAHSLGGLVALTTSRNESINHEVFTSTRGIFFLGTPHQGSKSADLARVITNVVSVARSTATQYLDVLKRDSNELLELSQAFEPLTRDGTLELRSFYETEKTRVMVGKFRWRSIEIVDNRSALIGSSGEKRFPIAADHRSICKFDHESNQGFVQIVSQMKDVCRNLVVSSEVKCIFVPPGRLPLDVNFFGRESILREICDKIRPEGTNKSLRCLCLHGHPGVGKTQLAAKTAQDMTGTFRHILFVQADTSQKLLQSFLAIGRHLNLASGESPEPTTVRSQVLDWLRKQDLPWLLIFDNVEEARPLLQYLPENGQGSVILTSRNGKIANGLSMAFSERASIQVSGMDPDEGRNFLLRQLKDTKGAVKDQDDLREISLSVAERFYYHPLALRQASAFIRETESTITKLWDLLQINPANDLQVYNFQDQSTPYEESLWSVWRMILASLDHGAAKLLTVFCLFDPDGIPDELFVPAGVPNQGIDDRHASDPIEYFIDRAPLMRYEILMQRAPSIISVHRLVQRVRLNNVSTEEKEEAFEVALRLLARNFPKQHLGAHLHDQWARCELFLSHVLAIDTMVHQLSPELKDPVSYIDMLCDCTWYLWEIEQYDEALGRLEQLEKLCAETIGIKTLQGARILVNRGSIYARCDHLLESGACFRRALEIRQRLLPDDDQLLANSYMQVGNWYTSQGQYDQAERHLRSSIKIRDASIPGQTIISHQNLARCLQLQGKLDESGDIVNKSAEVERAMGTSKEAQYHKFGRLYIQGNIHLGRGDYRLALDSFKAVFDGRKSLSISAGPFSAACHKVGVAHQMLGNYEEAR